MKRLVLLVGCQGAGKTHFCQKFLKNYTRISQDDSGKEAHKQLFEKAIKEGVENIVVDRINHLREQRSYYLKLAKDAGYETQIKVMNVPYSIAYTRIQARAEHPTLAKEDAHKALGMYFSKYEYVLEEEADMVIRSEYDPYMLDLRGVCEGKRVILIGDLHGCYDELQELLKQQKYDPNQDVIILTGDLSDRGPKVKECFQFLEQHKHIYCVQSNHDNKLLRTLRGNPTKSEDTQKTLQQLEDTNLEALRMRLESFPYVIRFRENSYVVHAGIVPEYPIERQWREALIYARTWEPVTKSFVNNTAHPWYQFAHKERMYFGHQVHMGDPFVGGRLLGDVALDGGCVFGGTLRACVNYPGGIEEIAEVKANQTYYKNTHTEELPYHPNLQPFEKKVLEGYIRKSETEDLVIYSYTDKCTFDRYWDDITTQARGIIFEKATGKCIAKPFRKFYNLGEHETTFLQNLPKEPYKVYDKLDGSLAVIFNYKGKWTIATRGSFTSPQAVKAQEIFDKKYAKSFEEGWGPHVTFCAEIIYPANRMTQGARLVCDYGITEDLVFLAAFQTDSGQEQDFDTVAQWVDSIGMPTATQYDYTIEQMIELQKTLPKDVEGFVVRFENGLRIKIKGQEYLKMQKILNSISPLSTWEVMKNGVVPQEYVQSLPEEIRPEIEAYAGQLEEKYKEVYILIYSEALRLQTQIICNTPKFNQQHSDTPEWFKALGLALKNYTGEHKAAMFLVWRDNKEALDSYITKVIRPHANLMEV